MTAVEQSMLCGKRRFWALPKFSFPYNYGKYLHHPLGENTQKIAMTSQTLPQVTNVHVLIKQSSRLFWLASFLALFRKRRNMDFERVQ